MNVFQFFLGFLNCFLYLSMLNMCLRSLNRGLRTEHRQFCKYTGFSFLPEDLKSEQFFHMLQPRKISKNIHPTSISSCFDMDPLWKTDPHEIGRVHTRLPLICGPASQMAAAAINWLALLWLSKAVSSLLCQPTGARRAGPTMLPQPQYMLPHHSLSDKGHKNNPLEMVVRAKKPKYKHLQDISRF